LDNEAFEVFRDICNRNQQKCTMHMQVLEFDLIGDISKTKNQILQVAADLQIIDYSVQYLEKNPNFNLSAVDLTDQLLLPDMLIIKALYVCEAVKLVEVFYTQRDTFKEEKRHKELFE